jgi:flagellar hook assembly protein FlgD
MRDAAAFEWSLAREGPVTLTIHDLAGRRVATLESGEHPAGPHRSRWDGRDGSGALEPPGVYIARLVTRGEWLTARFVLAR